MQEEHKNTVPEQPAAENTAGAPASEPKKKSKSPVAVIVAAVVVVAVIGIFRQRSFLPRTPRRWWHRRL